MLLEALARQLRARDDAGLARRRRIAETACAARQTFTIGHAPPRSLLNFAGNDYLGLAEHPWVVAAWIDGARRYGAGSGGSHLLGGHSRAHATLEDELGALLAPCIPKARALFFGTGYLANLAVVGALPKLAQVDATLYCDSLNHASLIDGARLSGVPREIYPHRDLPALEALLAAGRAPLKFIVTDAVFSMDGDIADLAGLLALAERHDAWLVVDDAHGFGVHGRQGRGSLDLAGVRSERLLCIGTLGKAAGVAGAFVAAHPTVVEALLQCARPYVYTTAAPSAIAHALLASLRIITGTEGDARRARWRERAAQLRAGWPGLLPSATPIQPLVVGDASAAVRLSTALEGEGLLVPAIRPPTVPDGTARLRISLSAAHTAADVEQLLGGLRRHADALATVAA